VNLGPLLANAAEAGCEGGNTPLEGAIKSVVIDILDVSINAI
jgi:hypothetical protein